MPFTPYTEEELEEREKRLAQQNVVSDIVEETPPEDTSIFRSSFGKGVDITQAAFQRTAQKVASDLGFEDLEKRFKERAELNEEEAKDATYIAKYGEEGLAQFKNMSDPKWWKQTMGEAIPGSTPFLGAAVAAGGTAALLAGGPITILAAAAIAGGLAVFGQEYGSSYYSYLEENPEDEEGAENYALKKSGLSGVINAATVPMSLAGIGTTPIKQFIIQAALQGGMESGDAISGNLLEKKYLDPDLDWSTGVARGIAGEIFFETPVLVRGTRKRVKTAVSKEVAQEREQDQQKNLEEKLDKVADVKIREIIDESGLAPDVDIPSTDTLKEIIGKQGWTNDIAVNPTDTRETIFNKIKQKLRNDAEGQMVFEEMRETVMSELTHDDVYKQQKAIFDNMTDEQLQAKIDEEFGDTAWLTDENVLDDEGNIMSEVDRQRNYQSSKDVDFGFWGTSQKGDFGFSSSFFSTVANWTAEENQIVRDAFSNASANIIMRAQGDGPIWAMGKNEFDDSVRDLKNKYTKGQLTKQVKILVPYFPDTKLRNLSKEQLAEQIAETMMVLEMQQRKKVSLDENRSIEHIVKKEDANSPLIRSELRPQGNAVAVELWIEDNMIENQREREAGARKVYFTRGAERDYTDTILEKIAVTPDDALMADPMIAPGGKVVWPSEFTTTDSDPRFTNKTLDQIEQEFPNARIGRIVTTPSSISRYQDGVVNKTMGWLSAWFRPMGRMGLITTMRQKELMGRIRVHEANAKEIAMDIEKAIAKAGQKPSELTTDQARKLLSAFMKKTGAHVPLPEEVRKSVQAELDSLTNSKYLMIPEEMQQIDNTIEELRAILDGPQKTSVALNQLPTKALRDVALRSRKGIDALSTRILKEFPQEYISDMDREIIEANLNSYVVNSFALFEPKLGWNPRFSKAFLRSKKMQDLYDKAVAQTIELNKDKGDWQGRTPEESERKALIKAKMVVDNILAMKTFKSTQEITPLPGVMEAVDTTKRAPLEKGPKLMQARYEIPYATRKLMGEIEDPTIMAATSFSRVAKLIELANFYRDLKRINDMPGEMLFSPQRNDAAGFTYQIPKEDNFNPLAGMWMPKDIAKGLQIQRISEANDWTPVIKAYEMAFLAPKAAVQYGMIVLSPPTQIRNFEGAAIMFVAGGHLIQGDWTKTNRVIKQELFGDLYYDEKGQVTGESKQARKMMRLGRQLNVVHTSVRLNDALGIFNEMSSGEYNSIEKIKHGLYVLKQTPPGKFLDKTMGATKRAFQASYAAADDYFKMMSWGANMIEIKNSLDRLSKSAATPLSDEMKLRILREYSSTLTTKAGTYRSDAAVLYRNVTDLDTYIAHIAAYMTRNEMPNYDFIGPFAKLIRKIPLGNFIAFPTEIIRTTGNLAQMTWKDLSYTVSPELMREAGLPMAEALVRREDGTYVPKAVAQRPFFNKGIKRLLLGAAAMVGLREGFIALGQFMFDVDDDELAAANDVGPDYAANNAKVPTSKVRDDGTGMDYVNVDYTFPYEMLVKIYDTVQNSVRRGEVFGEKVSESVMKGIWTWLVEGLESYYGVSIASKVTAELLMNKNLDTDRPIYNEEDNLGEKLAVGIQYALNNAGPGGYVPTMKVVKAFSEGDEKYTEYGEPLSEIKTLARLAGISQSEANPDKSLGFYISQIKKGFDKHVESNMDPIQWRRSKITEEDVLEQWQDAQEIWFRMQQEMYFKLKSFETMKLSSSEKRKQFNESLNRLAGVDGSKVRRNLEKGIFTPWELPSRFEKSFNKIKRELDLERTWPGNELRTRTRALKRPEISLLANPELPLPWEED